MVLVDLRLVKILREIKKLLPNVLFSSQVLGNSKDEVRVHHHP